jgi:hypothetical protein
MRRPQRHVIPPIKPGLSFPLAGVVFFRNMKKIVALIDAGPGKGRLGATGMTITAKALLGFLNRYEMKPSGQLSTIILDRWTGTINSCTLANNCYRVYPPVNEINMPKP